MDGNFIEEAQGLLYYEAYKTNDSFKNKVLTAAAAALWNEAAEKPDKIASGFTCPDCGEYLDYKDNYCRHCGKAITWEGVEE